MLTKISPNLYSIPILKISILVVQIFVTDLLLTTSYIVDVVKQICVIKTNRC